MSTIEKGCVYCADKHTCPDAFTEVSPKCGAYDHSPAITLCSGCIHRGQETIGDVGSCNLCENGSYFSGE